MRGGEFPGMPFNGQMTFPCELSLKKYTEGIRLVRKPIKEIELLHQKGEVWENKNLIPGINKMNSFRWYIFYPSFDFQTSIIVLITVRSLDI